MLKNYHSHSQFCDAKATIEQFVEAAIAMGFQSWGVSPHSPLPMLSRAPWAMSTSQVDTYISHCQELKAKYRGSIELLVGMEIDYIGSDYNPNSPYFQNLPLDFRIGSVHMLRSPRTGELVDIDCGVEQFSKAVDYHFAGSLQKVVCAYYEAMTAMVETGGFDFVGHTDKISSNTSVLSSKITSKEWYKALVDDFFVLCASRGVVLEINTKAYLSKQLFFPDVSHFDRMAELGIKVVINSDAHYVDRIAVGLLEARALWKGEVVSL